MKDQKEEEVNPRQDGFAGGEVITDVVLPIEIVHRRPDIHRDLHSLDAIREEERVLIGVGLVVHGINPLLPSGFTERAEGEDLLHHVRFERALDLAILKLLKDMDPRLPGAEEETDIGEVGIGLLWRERDGGDV